MTEVQPAKNSRTLGKKLSSTVLVLTVPVLLLAIIAAVGGSFGIGLVELSLLVAIWGIGLAWVWWPRTR
jgi:hypothetical protein